MYFSAALKVVRQDTFSRVNVGVNREVTVGIASVEGQSTFMLTRFFSREEIEQKKTQAIEDGKGEVHITPFANMSIPLEGAEIIYEQKDKLHILVSRMAAGIELSQEESMVRLSRSKESKLFLKLDSDTASVHVRKYWKKGRSGELTPQRLGVTISTDEFVRFLMHLGDLITVAKAHETSPELIMAPQ